MIPVWTYFNYFSPVAGFDSFPCRPWLPQSDQDKWHCCDITGPGTNYHDCFSMFPYSRLLSMLQRNSLGTLFILQRTNNMEFHLLRNVCVAAFTESFWRHISFCQSLAILNLSKYMKFWITRTSNIQAKWF